MKNYCLILFLFLHISVYAQNRGEIKGRVLDGETGMPVAGVTVFIHETGRGTFSDSTGFFRLSGLKQGYFHLHVNALGYTAESRSIKIDSGQYYLEFFLKPTTVELKQIVILGEYLKSEREDQTLSSEVVDESFLLKNSGSTLVESLEKLPGINSLNTGVGISKPVIRGMTFNRVIVNENGIKQQGQQWGLDHGLEMDQFGIGQVEIVKGPVSYLYGSDGIGGVLNVTTPAPPEAGTFGGELILTGKTNNNLLGASASTFIRGKNNWLRLRYSKHDYGDYKLPADSFRYLDYNLPIYHNRLKKTAGQIQSYSLAAGTLKSWGKASLVLSNFHQKAGFFQGAIGIPGFYSLRDDGNSRDINLPFQRINHFKLLGAFEIFLGNNWLETEFGYQNNMRQEFSAPHAHLLNLVSQNDNIAHQWELETYTLNTRYHIVLKDSLSMIAGLSGELMSNQRSGFEFLLPAYNQQSAGTYAFLNYKIKPGLSFSSGLRGDFSVLETIGFKQDFYNSNGDFESRTLAPEISRTFFNWSGGLGISWYASDIWNIKINAGRSFRTPSVPELTMNGVHHGTFRHEMGDSTLNSEKGYQFDFSLSLDKKNLLAVFTPFYNYFSNYIFLKPSVEFSPLPDGGQIYKYTEAEVIHSGFELQMEYHPVKKLHLQASGEYVYTYNLDSGLPLPFIPPFTFRTEAEVVGKKKFLLFEDSHAGFELLYAAAQNRTERNEKSTPGYILVNFNSGSLINMRFSDLEIYFRVNNIFNTKYFKHLSRYRFLNLPEPGRNILLTIKIPVSGKFGMKE